MVAPARFAIMLMMAAVVAQTSPAWARDQRTRQIERHNPRIVAPKRRRIAPTTSQTLKEPFTAAEKRALQEPTGKEIDRW
jgi:hypothetical protein